MIKAQDDYVAYCLDEACAFIINKIADGEEPKFYVHYSRPSELYAQYK